MKFDGTIELMSKIKLVIWDLDDTFWEGTLSEEQVSPILRNISLVKKLTERGIVNSICSKNDMERAKAELEKEKILDYFVFCSIDWSAKGNRIKQIINSMNLRPANVLFLDDNISNLQEAEFYNQGIMIASPDVISALFDAVESIGKDDHDLSRLKQYKVLENKQIESKKFESNEEFLKSSHILVEIKKPTSATVNRIYELIQRSNQLNFTKLRSTEEEIQQLILDDGVDCGCVYVKDNYGKYGMIGFYALKSRRLIHFLFSCRTMGMGIEQFIYSYLEFPELEIVQPVSGNVQKNAPMPSYINFGNVEESKESDDTMTASVLLKGPCDLEVMASYMESKGKIDTEFNFIDSNGVQADFFNHSINILNSLSMPDYIRQDLSHRYPFISDEAYNTRIFCHQYDVICLSVLMDVTLGVYRNKNNGEQIAYGLYSKPITKEEYYGEYINKQVMTARYEFTNSQLQKFSEEFELIEYTAADIATNYQRIIKTVKRNYPNTQFVIILLPELEYKAKDASSYIFKNKEKWHREVNNALKKNFSGDKSVTFLDVNKYIISQSCYYDNINHYSKMVYYKMAEELIEILNSRGNIPMHSTSKAEMLKQHCKRIAQKYYHKYFKRDLN